VLIATWHGVAQRSVQAPAGTEVRLPNSCLEQLRHLMFAKWTYCKSARRITLSQTSPSSAGARSAFASAWELYDLLAAAPPPSPACPLGLLKLSLM